MVYAALPAVYLDPPNWNQQSQQQLQQEDFQAGGFDGETDETGRTEQLLQLPTQVPVQQGGGTDGGTSSAKPLSTADRARLAKLPQQESAPVRCPRCDSTNTKFCYFNNYSLTQPRHFCKGCRRYWTRGGSLRNVPVGGGCRRNKRTKGGGSSKGSASAGSAKNGVLVTNSLDGGGGTTGAINSSIGIQSQLPFLASFQHFPDFGRAANYGGSITAIDQAGYYTSSSTGVRPDQWIHSAQMQQFPFLTGMEPSPPPLIAPTSMGLAYQQMTTDNATGLAAQLHAKPTTSAAGLTTQQKMQESLRPQTTMSMLRQQLLGVPGMGNIQYWANPTSGQDGSTEGGESAGPWADLSGFASSTVNLH